MPFYYDEDGFAPDATCFIMTGEHLSFLTAFFNSSLFKYCFKEDFAVLFGGARRLKKIYMNKIPILEVSDDTDSAFRELVLDIQKEYTDEKAKAIDNLIFDLYGLTQPEREMIGFIDYHFNNDDLEEEE